jgi:DHA1 family bicyclomycin/chloramphenicol resistance-like MFS transporter
MSQPLMVVFIAMMIGIQPVATDLYLPALPSLTTDLGASVAQAQFTLTALLLPFGLSQLVWGPLSDRYGRRTILLVGLASFTVAAAACALAQSMQTLLVWRVVQGVAMGAVVMTGRAVLRDGFEPTDAARVMSKAQSAMGLLACAGPPLGGLLTDIAGWRWAMAAVAVFGALALTLTALRFGETLPLARRAGLRPADLVANWVTVVQHPSFRAWSLLTALTYAGLFIFLATSPFVFTQVLGLSRTEFGLAVVSLSMSYIAGTFICRRLLRRRGMRGTVAVGGWISLVAGTALGLCALGGVAQTWTILAAMWVYTLGHGIHQACGQAGAVAPFPRMAGAASALNGCLMMVVAFLIGGLLGQHVDGMVQVMAYGIWIASCLLAAVAWTLVQRHGDPRPA